MSRTDSLITSLQLESHPEGGYFSETYRSEKKIQTDPDGGWPDGRSHSTAIYYLLAGDEISRFHRIRSDEVWHHYEGSSATIHTLDPKNGYGKLRLGKAVENGEQFQHIVPGGIWFGVTVDNPDSYLLAGCTVAPGFDFEDFEMADRDHLLATYPDHRSIIETLCP